MGYIKTDKSLKDRLAYFDISVDRDSRRYYAAYTLRVRTASKII
jgi:hypothetical protein